MVHFKLLFLDLDYVCLNFPFIISNRVFSLEGMLPNLRLCTMLSPTAH